jgi:hypothetical protein
MRGLAAAALLAAVASAIPLHEKHDTRDPSAFVLPTYAGCDEEFGIFHKQHSKQYADPQEQ